ncbi:MAG: CoA transferase [Deltaproteobacteria bacterium]|nr:CoA transferase [Deltaproteobacteria bacterium]
MNHNVSNEGMLSPYRVLDLTNERGLICGQLLSEMGADVIKIERPGGDRARNIGPFFHDIPDPENSLFWFAFNTNKRGITLDIETEDGRELFKELISSADIVIESFSPGYMEKLGLNYPVLKKINPRIIMTSITGFGQEGPYRDYKDADIVLWALSGNAFLTGDPDRAPLMPSFPMSYIFSGALQAAVGTMVALYHRHCTGQGQLVDASALLSLLWSVSSEPLGPWLEQKEIIKRQGRMWYRSQIGENNKTSLVGAPNVYQCKDGDINFTIMAGPSFYKSTGALSEWIESLGMAGETLKKIDWLKFEWATVSQDVMDEIVADFSNFFKTKTKAELFEEAQKRGIMMYPFFTPKEIMGLEQLKSRNYWVEVEHPELETTIIYPGSFFKTSEAFSKYRRRAPRIGEHNEDIFFNELKLSRNDLLMLKQAGVI